MSIVKPYFDGVERGELLLPWCKSCRKPHFYPRYACPHCWNEEYDWRNAAGSGEVHSFTVVQANPPSAFVPFIPYCIAIVDLQEGVRLLTNIAGDFGNLAIGDKVTLEFVKRDDRMLPAFRRVS